LGLFSDGRRIVYDIRLEGALTRGDAINRLTPSGDGLDQSISDTCATGLGCDVAEATDVLARVVVHGSEPPREFIEDRNLGDLRRAAGYLSANELKEVYEAAISLIDEAMRAALLADSWPRAILEPDSQVQEMRERAEAKRIDRSRLALILGRLDGSDRALMSIVTDPDRLRATDLERKMLAAGAPAQLVDQAKQVRAQAIHRMLEFRASNVLDVDSLLADLEFRLLSVATTAAATAAGASPTIWSAIETRLHTHPAHHDPRRILSQEPLLLMGAICQYSDECKFPWTSDA
ncbi:MAG: hypothetical protein M3P18_14180, partial [Actinomycetota bacterium]|nr:hypothetical protein [Actinomycetota bacterium]